MMKFDIYSEVTAQIITMLEAGVVPWRSPILGTSKAGWPRNLDSGKEYRGINVFMLAFAAWGKGYGSAHWLTYNQAKARGGSVRRGERATMVVFWKTYEAADKKTGEVITIPLLRYYNVFNVEQCEAITAPDATPPIEATAFTHIEAAEALVRMYEGRPEIVQGGSAGNRAFYVPASDAVYIPHPTMFTSPEAFYATLFHELAHSTGHSKRLDRELDTKLAPFGSPDYAREELVAEMAAAFLCGHSGITPVTVENSASYIAGWIKALKGDKRLVVAAAGAGQRASDWIRGQRGTGEGTAVAVDGGPDDGDSMKAEAVEQPDSIEPAVGVAA